MATVVTTALIFLFLLAVAVYVWPRSERFDKILAAIFGAFVGSLVGRVWADPSWPLHILFVAGGAFLFCGFDWIRHHYGGPGPADRLNDPRR